MQVLENLLRDVTLEGEDPKKAKKDYSKERAKKVEEQFKIPKYIQGAFDHLKPGLKFVNKEKTQADEEDFEIAEEFDDL